MSSTFSDIFIFLYFIVNYNSCLKLFATIFVFLMFLSRFTFLLLLPLTVFANELCVKTADSSLGAVIDYIERHKHYDESAQSLLKTATRARLAAESGVGVLPVTSQFSSKYYDTDSTNSTFTERGVDSTLSLSVDVVEALAGGDRSIAEKICDWRNCAKGPQRVRCKCDLMRPP